MTFRSKANRSNNYMLDRDVQRTETFSGIDGINAQDRAMQESMGRVVDRSKEHLGPADKAIIQARKLLLQAVKTVEAGGTPRRHRHQLLHAACARGRAAEQHRLARGVDAGDAERGDPAERYEVGGWPDSDSSPNQGMHA